MKSITRHWVLLLLVFVVSAWACRGFQLAWQQSSPGAAQQHATPTPQSVLPALPADLPANVWAFQFSRFD